MPEKRVTVWVQAFKDRPSLMLQWTDPDTGRRKSKSAGTADEKEAEQARADLEYQLNHGLHQEASRISWDRFRELFDAEYVAGARGRTRRNYSDTLDLFEKLCAPKSLKAITERTVSQFVAGMRKTPGRPRGSTGMMPSTIKVRLQFLHTALTWAAGQKMLVAVPKFPSVKVPLKAPQPVPTESFEKLLDKARSPELRAFVLCGWLAGLRLAEAKALEWKESDSAPYVDFGQNRIVLPAEFSKAVKDQWVPLDPELRTALEALPRVHARKVFLFTNRRGEPLGLRGVSHKVRALAKLAGVRMTMKTLRKGFGCRYAAKVSAHVLQRLMRHADIKITMTYYANIDDAVEEAVLGAKRNSSRNTTPSRPSDAAAPGDASAEPATTNRRRPD